MRYEHIELDLSTRACAGLLELLDKSNTADVELINLRHELIARLQRRDPDPKCPKNFPTEEWLDLMKKLFVIAIVLTMLVWRCTEPAHAQEDVDGAVSTNAPIWYTTAPLFIRSGPHDWLVASVHVVEYPDSRPVMCIARKDSQIVDCFYKNNVTGEGYLFSELPKEKRG